MIGFRLDARSGVPTYLQLVNQVKHALRLGLLEPGDRLPTAAEVVAALAINPNTVLKAYRELEREGLVGGPARHGDVRAAHARPGRRRRPGPAAPPARRLDAVGGRRRARPGGHRRAVRGRAPGRRAEGVA